ncbi:MAG: cytochrome P450 [Rhodospirillaceae bacterium]|nr:cytochrome P450 [Rhodospirillaceae bacterium]
MKNFSISSTFDFNSIGPDFIENPFPTCQALREYSPIHRNADGSLFLTRYADVLQVYREPLMSSDKKIMFEKKFGKTPLYEHHTTSLVFNDPPYHTVVRKLLSAGFTPRKLAEMEPLIVKIVNGLLDRLEDLSEFDLVEEYAMALPTEIISFMLGVPADSRHKLRQYSLNILGALDPVVSQERLDEGNASVEEFGEVLSEIIDQRRSEKNPKSDGEILMSLILGDVNGRRLTNMELVQNCIFLLNAGHETTTSMVANLMHMFFSAPDQLKLLKEDPDLITTAIEEGLRYESPLQVGNRVTTGEVEIGGQLLPIGTYIHTSIAGANRDPAEFYKPEEVDITRKPNRHIAFAMGHHVCLGATLARMEGRIAIGELVKRFPEIKQSGPAISMGLARFRGFNKLPVKI